MVSAAFAIVTSLNIFAFPIEALVRAAVSAFGDTLLLIEHCLPID